MSVVLFELIDLFAVVSLQHYARPTSSVFVIYGTLSPLGLTSLQPTALRLSQECMLAVLYLLQIQPLHVLLSNPHSSSAKEILTNLTNHCYFSHQIIQFTTTAKSLGQIQTLPCGRAYSYLAVYLLNNHHFKSNTLLHLI